MREYENNPEPRPRFSNGCSGPATRACSTRMLPAADRPAEGVINRAGEKSHRWRSKRCLLEHPAVRHAVVFALADRLMGEEVAAAWSACGMSVDETRSAISSPQG